MGAWGPKLYQDDIAQDIRDTYKDRLRRGKTTKEITEELIEEYSGEIEDIDDGPIFWFALADIQWDYGRLLPEVKENAIKWIEDGSDIRRWEEEGTAKEVKVRKEVLEQLKHKLESPMPEEKKVSQYRLYKCQWKIGDVYAYKMNGEYAKEKGFYGRYILFQKVGEGEWWPGHIIPIVKVKVTDDEQLPTEEEFYNLQYIKMSFEGESIYNGEKLFNYGLMLLNTSKRIIPKDLKYIGNYKESPSINNEYIITQEVSYPSSEWKDIEKYIIDDYTYAW